MAESNDAATTPSAMTPVNHPATPAAIAKAPTNSSKRASTGSSATAAAPGAKTLSGWRRPFAAFQSRGVRVAFATVILAIGAQYGVHLDENITTSIVALGAALVLKIGIEDHGSKMGLPPRNTGDDDAGD